MYVLWNPLSYTCTFTTVVLESHKMGVFNAAKSGPPHGRVLFDQYGLECGSITMNLRFCLGVKTVRIQC